MTEDRTGAGGATPAPASPTTVKESKDMATTIGGTNEDVTITGTGISHVPLTGRPEFDGLLVDEHGNAVARIRDGALVLEIGDIDLAIAWRNAWQHAVAHMVIHRQRQEGRS